MLLHGPRENHLLKRGSKGIITVGETLRVTKKMWGPCSWIYQAEFTEEKWDRNEVLSTSFKNGDNHSTPQQPNSRVCS